MNVMLTDSVLSMVVRLVGFFRLMSYLIKLCLCCKLEMQLDVPCFISLMKAYFESLISSIQVFF